MELSKSGQIRRGHLALSLLIVASAVLTGCTRAGGGRVPDLTRMFQDRSEPAAGESNRRSGSGSVPTLLSADDLSLVYQGVLDQHVDPVEPAALVDGAMRGLHSGAQSAGLLPLETALLETTSLIRTGDSRRDWDAFASRYRAFLQKLGPRVLLAGIGQATVRGMLATLDDPFAEYLDGAELVRRESRGTGGIGLVLAIDRSGLPVVRKVVRESAAARSAIEVGDLLVAADGLPAEDMGFFHVIETLSGPEGSPIAIRIRPANGQPDREVVLQRAMQALPPVSIEDITGIVHVQVRTVERSVVDELRRVLSEPSARRASGWVLDLRGNSSGSVEAAAEVATLFLGSRPLGATEGQRGRGPQIIGEGPSLPEQRPLVVLVDGATAGPAELLAAALGDHQRAVTVGGRTAGRLGATGVIPLPDGSAAIMATQRFVSPSGSRLLGEGFQPAVTVALEPRALAVGRDAQLEAAVRQIGILTA